MSNKDFRARQIRTNQIINSGSNALSPMLVYGLGSATNDSGGFRVLDFVTGSDTWLYISGAIGSGAPGSSGRGLVTFGGDVYVSGTIYGGGGGGGGTPGGVTTSVQFNDGSGNFGGDADLTWQKVPNILTITGSVLTTGLAQFAGGYGNTGVTISPAGNISTDGTLTVDGAATINSTTIVTGALLTTTLAQFAGGYGSSGITITDSGNFSTNGSITVDGTALIGNTTTITGALLTTAFAQFAGGYGSSGVTIANNGDFSTNGSVIIDGTTLINNTTTITGTLLTSGPAQFAGGFGSSGVTIANNGDTSIDGALTVNGTSALKGDTLFGDATTDRLTFNARVTSSIIPANDVAFSLGSPALHWANIYTGDLHLRNDRGDWTIVEEPDFLRIVNNKTGKNYKMMMQPIDD